MKVAALYKIWGFAVISCKQGNFTLLDFCSPKCIFLLFTNNSVIEFAALVVPLTCVYGALIYLLINWYFLTEGLTVCGLNIRTCMYSYFSQHLDVVLDLEVFS